MTKFFCLLVSVAALAGCATYQRQGLNPTSAETVEKSSVARAYNLTPATETAILAMNPERVSEREIRSVLANAPAPRMINIHGGIYPVHLRMVSFSEFLIGMGYPKNSIRNPGDGTLTFSCYEDSGKIAGVIAWYYEKEGMRPIMVGHSQGGMQAVKVLYKFSSSSKLAVWNPLTWKNEERYSITDPLTGQARPAAGLRLAYATSVGAGGLTRVLPNQWDMSFKLRRIPNTVEEFTGFYKNADILGGDFLGYGSANLFKSTGSARVRNVELPSSWPHGKVPDTKHLLRSQAIKDRINNYTPTEKPQLSASDITSPETLNISWAQDVWFSIKKHWVLELQRLIRARRAARNA